MDRASMVIIIGSVSVLFTLASAGVPLGAHAEPSDYTWHVPVIIEGDEEFTEGNGVTGGSGTLMDPFIIEGWEFTGGYAGIRVFNTSAHFVIRDIYTHDNGIGVMMRNVTNATVERADCDFNWFGWNFYGMFLDRCSKVNISQSNVSVHSRGVYVLSSNLCNIGNNNLSNNNLGVFLESSCDCTVRDNTVTASAEGAVTTLSCEGILISENRIIDQESGNGIAAMDSRGLNVSGNTLERVPMGFFIDGSEEITVDDNHLTQSYGTAVKMSSSTAVTVSGNHLSEVYFGLEILSSEGISMMDNTLSSAPDVEWAQGLALIDSVGTALENNTFETALAVDIWGTEVAHFHSHHIPAGNVVQGADIVYFSGETGIQMDGTEVGQLIVADCVDVDISGLGPECTRVDFYFVENASLSMSEARSVKVMHSKDVAFLGNEMIAPEDSNGIRVTDSEHVTVVLNEISAPYSCVSMDRCDEVVVAANTMEGPGDGVSLHYCTNVSVTGNNVSAASSGVTMWGSSFAEVESNSVEGGAHGIVLSTAFDVSVAYNDVSRNSRGICLYSTTSVTVHHNNIRNNSVQALDDDGTGNSWDAGYPEGGNFWSDYAGTDQFQGPGQNLPGPDGIGDVPYTFSGSEDRYPLILETGSNTAPVADAGEDIQASVGQEVTFNGTGSWDDGGIVNYTWTFAYDGQEVTLLGETPGFEFHIPGEYMVTLTVWDSEGLHDTDTVTVTIVQEGEPDPDDLLVMAVGLVVAVTAVVVALAVVLLTRRPEGPGEI